MDDNTDLPIKCVPVILQWIDFIEAKIIFIMNSGNQNFQWAEKITFEFQPEIENVFISFSSNGKSPKANYNKFTMKI